MSVQKIITVLPPSLAEIPKLDGVSVTAGPKLHFDLSGTPGVLHRIKASVDFKTWQPMTTVVAPATVDLEIPGEAGASFYRAVRIP